MLAVIKRLIQYIFVT